VIKIIENRAEFSESRIRYVIESCLVNNQMAQSALFKIFYRYGRSISIRFSNNNQEAKEILQDSFVKMYMNLTKFDPNGSFKSWTENIIINTAIDYDRKNKR
jgi:RNA polymerase sigma factor (sigma-70 family)